MIAQSARIQSTRVFEMIATRCSGWMPSASRPAAHSVTCSPVSRQVIETQPSPTGRRNASRSGVAATRSVNNRATEGARVITRVLSRDTAHSPAVLPAVPACYGQVAARGRSRLVGHGLPALHVPPWRTGEDLLGVDAGVVR